MLLGLLVLALVDLALAFGAYRLQRAAEERGSGGMGAGDVLPGGPARDEVREQGEGGAAVA